MGAVEFQVLTKGENGPDAFFRAVSQAQAEYGHDPYSGTIGVKYDFRIVTPGVLSYEDAKALDQKYQDAIVYFGEDENKPVDPAVWNKWNPYDDKWGAAGCIEVDPSSLSDSQRQWMGVREGDRVFYFFGIASY